MHVGFVGTGNMGAPMAANILKAGHTMTVHDARPEATAELERLAPGLLNGAQRGDVVFDLSTVSPESTRRLAERAAAAGVRLVDAPVSGSVSGARAGTLAVMIGADAETLAPYEPVFRAIGTHLFALGELGRGNILKLLNNYVALTNQAALCEAMALADRLGIPRDTVADVLGRSSGGSFILERKRAALAAHDYRAGFFVDLALKDLRLALEMAEQAGARSAVAREAWRLYGEARGKGLGSLDSSGLLKLLEP